MMMKNKMKIKFLFYVQLHHEINNSIIRSMLVKKKRIHKKINLNKPRMKFRNTIKQSTNMKPVKKKISIFRSPMNTNIPNLNNHNNNNNNNNHQNNRNNNSSKNHNTNTNHFFQHSNSHRLSHQSFISQLQHSSKKSTSSN